MRNLFFICNALDDLTRLERGIVTDSPAASHKVFGLSKAMRKAGVHVLVISLGRGRQDASGRYFRCKVHRVNGVAVIYLPLLHFPILSELLTLLSSVPLLWRLNKRKKGGAVLFYNRMVAYLPLLIFAKIFRIDTVLDLEDGETNLKYWSLSGIKSVVLSWLFDTVCCYGTSDTLPTTVSWDLPKVNFLLGGTVSEDTGALLLIQAIKLLRDKSPAWAKDISFNITGKGDCLELFQVLAMAASYPEVIVHGRTTDDEYSEILANTHVGLALKPNSGVLAHTTFPSKVIEFASHGILVVTTDISDVRKVLTDGAVYLEVDDPMLLIDKLRWILEHRGAAKAISLKGQQLVSVVCEPQRVGEVLSDFIFKSLVSEQH